MGSVVATHGVSYSETCWDHPGPGMEPVSPALQVDSLLLIHGGQVLVGSGGQSRWVDKWSGGGRSSISCCNYYT